MKLTQPNPAQVFGALMASEVAVLRSRDPQLSSVLDVAPPIVKEAAPAQTAPPPGALVLPGVPPGLYGYLRRGYRFLNRFEPLRPVLQHMRSTAARVRGRQPRVSPVQNARPQSVVREINRTRLSLPRVSRSYTIAFTMRSGSNEICNLLARNGLGVPNEFFQNPLPPDPGGLLLNSFGRIVGRYQAEGVFGSKMSNDHRARLDEQLREVIAGYRRLDDVLPAHRWVWLKRRDKILQAISWCRAEQSKQWAKADVRRNEPSSFDYDFFHILSRIFWIFASELSWEAYFSDQKIAPLVIVYEEFFEDLDRQLPQLIEYLGGLPAGRRSVDRGITYAMQRDEATYAIRQRFVSDLCRIGEQSMAQELGQSLQRWVQFFFQYGWRG